MAFRCSLLWDPSTRRHIDMCTSRHGSLLGSSLVFLMPSHGCQEWSVDLGAYRLVEINRHIKDSWFLSSCLGPWLTDTVVDLKHLIPLFTCQMSGQRHPSWKAEGALCRSMRGMGLSRVHFSTFGQPNMSAPPKAVQPPAPAIRAEQP